MSILSKEKFDYWFEQNYRDKIKQREALENAHGNFVEPHINQFIAVNSQSLTTIPINPPGLYCTSAWLFLALGYCAWLYFLKRLGNR